MKLDLQTLSFVLGLASLLQVIALFGQWRANKERAGLQWWTLGSASFTVGFLMNGLRTHPRIGPYAIVANNLFLIGGATLTYMGVLRFFRRREPLRRFWFITVATILVATWFTLVNDDMAIRRVLFSGTVAAISLAIAWALRANRTPQVASSVNFLAVVFTLFGTFFAARALTPFLGSTEPHFFAPSPLQTATYLVTLAGGMLWSFGFIILVNQRLNAESLEARSALRENNLFLTELIENNGALIYVKDLEGRYTLVNKKWEEVTGNSRSSVLGRTDVDLFPGEDGLEFRRLDMEAMRRGQVVEDEEALTGPEGERHFLSIKFPLRNPDGSVRGLCGISSDITQRKADEQRIRELAAQLELERDYAQASALTDGLTRLANRRHFDDTLNAEFYRLKRSWAPLSLIMLDVDHFKNFNDHYGHPAGDACLRAIGAAIQATVGRASDLAARFGGEEFAVVLPETDAAGALGMAERIRKAVEDLALPHGWNSAGPTVTVSLGVVTRSASDLASPDRMVHLADKALYAAKLGGRNRVSVAVDEVPAPGGAPDLIRLNWRDAAESGNAHIDGQHRALFDASNELLSALIEGAPGEACGNMLQGILTALAEHFRDEEELLRAVHYPQAAAHAARHEEMLARARDLARSFEADQLPIGDLFSFLAYEVIAQHLFREDRKFFPYLAGKAGGSTD